MNHQLTVEKIHLFDRFGDLAKPLKQKINGMEWEFSLHATRTLDGRAPAIDVRYSCKDFTGHEGCFVLLKLNSRQVAHFFQINKSVIFMRQVYIGHRFDSNETVHLQNLKKFTTAGKECENEFSDWIFDELDKTKTNWTQEPFSFYDPIMHLTLIHLSMRKLPLVTKIYFSPTSFSSEYGEIPMEFDPRFLQDVNPDASKLIKNLSKKGELELRELRDVFGYFYHEFKNGIVDSRLREIECIAHKYGFYINALSSEDMFTWKYRSPCLIENTGNEVSMATDHTPVVTWEESFCKAAKLTQNTCMKLHHEFEFDGKKMHFICTIFKRTINSNLYLSFGILFIIPPSEDVYNCKATVSSTIPKLYGEVERCLKLGQNTLAIPALCEFGPLLGKLIAFKIDVKLEKVPIKLIENNVVFPAIHELMLKFKTRTIIVDRDVLTHHIDFFKMSLSRAHFNNPPRTLISLDNWGFEGMFHLLDAIYHGSKQFTVETLNEFGIESHALDCVEMMEMWKDCLLISKSPEIRQMIRQQMKHTL